MPFAALTNGATWLAFRPIRTDGKPLWEGKAIAFPTLDSISENFAEYYDLFSREAVLERRYTIHLNRVEGLVVSHAEDLFAATPDGEIRLQPKTPLARDLDTVFSEFFTSLSGDDNPEMLATCFVETAESYDADRNLEKITHDIIDYVEQLHVDAGGELRREIATSVETQRGQTVLIIGNKGSGKSTFVDRFFNLILDKTLRKRCLVLHLDLADSSGDLANIHTWLTTRLREEIENQLYRGATPDFDELMGILFKEYQRWSNGEFKHLYDTDKVKFKIRFGEFLFASIETDADKYVLRLLEHAIRARRLTPCLVFDNADHFPQPFQEAVFQYAQSIFRAVLSVVIVPVTDRTLWQLSKAGPLQSYATRTFYLPVPSTSRVLDKRIAFVKAKIELESASGEHYFLSRGIRINVENIKAFAAYIEEIFIQNDLIARRVGWLSNHDIRRSLELSRRIVTSPILGVDDLVKVYLVGQSIHIPRYKIMMALILGGYNRYLAKANEFVLNVFTVDKNAVSTPLLKLSLLRLLMDREAAASAHVEAYVEVGDIERYFEPMGIGGLALTTSLRGLQAYRLVEPYDPTWDEIAPEQRLAITSSGRMHMEMALNDETYVEQMALTTPVRSEELYRRIRDAMRGKLSRELFREIRADFMTYCFDQDERLATVPKDIMYGGQDLLRTELRGAWFGK